MVGNNENILVEFDYNNISIVDPNKVIDDNGKAKERVVKQEDMVMYANLECSLLPRTKLALGVANNDSIKTVSIASINFLKPGNKQFLDNQWTDEVTGKGSLEGKGVNQVKLNTVINPFNKNDKFVTQQTYTNGKPGVVDNGLLGIQSINVRQNTSFMPTVVIKLIDVKGRALFEGADNSPYAAFFNLPYPMFYLTLKGYYGKAVRLTLMLQNFTSSYNYSTTNFEITLTFYSYKFTLLSEVSMGALLAVPHMFKSSLSVETKQGTPSQYTPVKDSVVAKGYQKIKEVYSEYKTKGLIPDDFPELTIIQLKNRIDNFIKSIFESLSQENTYPLTKMKEYQDTLSDYKKEVYTAVNDSWFKRNIDTENYFIYNTGLNQKIKIYPLKNTIPNSTTAINELNDLITNFNNKLNLNETVGSNGSYKIGNKTFSSTIDCNIRLSTFQVQVTDFDTDIDIKETYISRKKLKTIPDDNDPDFMKFKSDQKLENKFNIGETKKVDGELVKVQYWFKFDNENVGLTIGPKVVDFNNSVLKPNTTFVEKLSALSKQLKDHRKKIEDDLTNALYDLLQSKDSGIGFVPNIRNILSVFFASAEAFIRLLDETSKNAWLLNENKTIRKYRRDAIFNSETAIASPDNLTPGVDGDQPIYPWPQFIVATANEKGKEKYEIRYPGDITFQSQIKSNDPDAWPEVEFVEEFISALVEKDNLPSGGDLVSNEGLDIKRISLNAIEFPIENNIYSNKEEVKYFFEIYERIQFITTVSKLSRVVNSLPDTDKIIDLISESETENMLNSLSSSDPYIIKKLTEYGFNANNFLEAIRHFSNEGVGQSWQNHIRGVYNTTYIKNKSVDNGFLIYSKNILENSKTSPMVSLLKESDLSNYIGNSVTSNFIDFTDIYPFTNQKWIIENLSDSSTAPNSILAFNTNKVLSFNQNRKIICNFVDNADSYNRRPISNFNYINYDFPKSNGNQLATFNLKDFYKNRTNDKQLPSEGNVIYSGYVNQLNYIQTTSIFNTPYFINSIQEGISNFRNYSPYPFVSSAYYFINSLPLSTLREKYKTYENGSVTDLDYIFATIKKFGAVHKVPYAWILKFGSIWHRYKKYVETGNDILNTSWTGFSYVNNYDPITNNPSKTYTFINKSALTEFTLQKTTYNGPEEYNTINLGFYPKLIDDFNVFLQGFQVYGNYTSADIELGFSSGITLNYSQSSIIDSPKGFDPINNQRQMRIVPWSLAIDDYKDNTNLFVLPSHGSLINQTLNECFDINSIPNKLKNEVIGNTAMYNGSVRLFWAAPNYGFFDDELLYKPAPFEYMKKVFSGEKNQENFSIRYYGEYTPISEMFSVFEKGVLDKFESIFLDFSKSIYDFKDPISQNDKYDGNIQDSPSENTFKNFQGLMREMMKVTKQTYLNGDDFVKKIQSVQLDNVMQKISGFLNYDVVFKYGNPSSFDTRLFKTFANQNIVDPYTWEAYTVLTPNALPSQTGVTTLAQSVNNYPDEWKALQVHIGFSEIDELKYKTNGSYITDFFIDLNIAFTVNNIKNFAPIIKLYATHKLKNKKIIFDELLRQYFDSLDSFSNKILNSLFIKLQTKLPKTTITSDRRQVSVISGGQQTKSEIYQSFKALNDKWIAGNDFENKTLFEDVLLMDRASRNIGEKVLVDISKLQTMLSKPNTTTSVLTYVQSILIDNHFLVMNLPSYVNFYNVQDAVKNPIPRSEGTLEFANTLFGTHMNVDYRESSAKMVCFYAGKPGENLDLKDNVDFRYRTDAFDLRRAGDVLSDDLVDKKDWALSNKVVGFNVDIGPQNQQIFVGFDVAQTVGKATTESIEILTQMGNVNNSRGGSTQSISLYNLYKNRSYTCSLTMMGNALIQPTMYFNLRHVPMFSGPYMILEVNHTISQGSFMTYIKGSRQSIAQLSFVDDYLQSLKANIISSVIAKAEKKNKEKDSSTTGNTTNSQQQTEISKTLDGTSTTSVSANINACIENLDPKYSKYINQDTGFVSISFSDMKRIINQKTIGFDSKLGYTIFAKFYLSSFRNNTLNAYGNNYAYVTLDEYWSNGEQFFVKDNYYCSNKLKKPTAIFESPEKLVDFFVSRWKNKMSLVQLNEKSISKFVFLNSSPTTKDNNIYDGLSSESKSNFEGRTKNAINIFEQTIV